MYTIVYGDAATAMERLACDDLQRDLQEVSVQPVTLLAESEPLPAAGIVLLVGAPATNRRVAALVANGRLPISPTDPGPRGGCITILDGMIVLAGCDAQGAQYAVYDFCRDSLGIDPCRYWTGYQPAPQPDFGLTDVHTGGFDPPHVPILCYFDNDNDELANLHPPLLEFSWEQWQALIDMLVRLRFNALDPHDHFGRTEYFTRPAYRKLRPDYAVNIPLLEQVIDYAHAKGMLVQVWFGLGWHFRPLSDAAASSWGDHKAEWLNVWRYYLAETPIGRCDIFTLRPRHPKLDHPYRSHSDEDVVAVFQEVFAEMRRLVKAHNPQALLIADLYAEGLEVYAAGFRPQPAEDFLLLWPDDGYGRFPVLPEPAEADAAAEGGDGIYAHAGFWLNHVVADPYPQLLATEMGRAILEYKAGAYCLVNGQTVRHFLLNLSVCSAVCTSPERVDGATFEEAWLTRYFGGEAAARVKQIYAWLHQAQVGKKGYVELLWLVEMAMRRLEGVLTGAETEAVDTAPIRQRIALLEKADTLAADTMGCVDDQADFYHDQVVLPLRLLLQINRLLFYLSVAANCPSESTYLEQAIEQLAEHTETRLNGDRNGRWAGWYDPAKARPNNGYPDSARLKTLRNEHYGDL